MTFSQLPPKRVALWRAMPDQLTAAQIIRKSLALFDEGERHRYRQFLHDRDRHTYLIAHVLRRFALSQYAPVGLGEWRFRTTPGGRPEVVGPLCCMDFRASIAHTDGLVLCAVSRSTEVGADVERADRQLPRHLDAIVLTRPERDALARLAPGRRAHRFLELWTLKEAYAKGRGLGLSLPFNQFGFDLDSCPDRIGFSPPPDDDESPWGFSSLSLEGTHIAAVACRSPDSSLLLRQETLSEAQLLETLRPLAT